MKKSLGLFGVGRWGKNIARIFFELGALNSIFDPCLENVQKIKDNYKDVNFCNDEDEIFSDPDIDKVAIATRIPSHTRLILKALRTNKDVFVEKPVCFDLKDARLIKKTARENGRIVMVGHILHYHPAVIKLKELIRLGEIGELISISSTRLCFGYIKEERNSLWSLATHDISLILSIINAMPESTFAVTSGMRDKQSDDIFNCFLNFSNKVKAHIKVNWLNPYKEQRFIVIGTEGLLMFDDVAKWDEKLKLFRNPRKDQQRIFFVNEGDNFDRKKIDYQEPLKNECQDFLECCEKRTPPFTNIDESIQVIQVINSLLNSANNDECLSFIKESFVQSRDEEFDLANVFAKK